MGRRTISTDLVRNIELLVGVALPVFLTGVWVQDQVTGSGHWAHPLESAFFVWLSLVPLLAFLGLLHSVLLAVVAAVWPRAAHRGTVVLGSVLLAPLLLLAGRPLETLIRYVVPLAVALAVYAWSSRVPGSRAPPADDWNTAPLDDEQLLGREPAPKDQPRFAERPPEATRRAPLSARQARRS